jgi:hypothetical protein
MCVTRAFEFHDHLNEHPTADEILAARYLKPREKKTKASAPPANREAAFEQMQAMSGTLGTGLAAADRLPPHLREIAMQALEIEKKLKKHK